MKLSITQSSDEIMWKLLNDIKEYAKHFKQIGNSLSRSKCLSWYRDKLQRWHTIYNCGTQHHSLHTSFFISEGKEFSTHNKKNVVQSQRIRTCVWNVYLHTFICMLLFFISTKMLWQNTYMSIQLHCISIVRRNKFLRWHCA